MSLVACITLDGQIKMVPQECLVLRPAAYAIVVHDGRVLLVRLRRSGKYHPPGGGIHLGERVEEALKREVREETGIEIEVERFARFEELFFYYDPSGTAYHGLHFYYICRPRTLALLDDSRVDDDAAEQPRWVSVAGLHAEEFQAHGELIVGLCRELAAEE